MYENERKSIHIYEILPKLTGIKIIKNRYKSVVAAAAAAATAAAAAAVLRSPESSPLPRVCNKGYALGCKEFSMLGSISTNYLIASCIPPSRIERV